VKTNRGRFWCCVVLNSANSICLSGFYSPATADILKFEYGLAGFLCCIDYAENKLICCTNLLL